MHSEVKHRTVVRDDVDEGGAAGGAALRRGGRRKLVLVGNGMAGMRAIEELLALAPELYDITVFGNEPHGNYRRRLGGRSARL